MADRGFKIRDLLTKKGVKLNMPPFTKGNQCWFCYKNYSSGAFVSFLSCISSL